jgi:hypothetical protein
MPKPSRTPINYRPQFSETMFRPREVVEAELAEEPPTTAGRRRRKLPESETLNERTNERSDERTSSRLQVRHSFDVWQDQLAALAEMQAQRFTASGRKPKMGTLVQEALDAYIAAHSARTNERSNERSSP